MGGARAVRLYAALGAPHRRCGFRYVQLFPVTQKKCLALTGGQLFKGLSDQIRNLRALHAIGRTVAAAAGAIGLHVLQRIVILGSVPGMKRGKQRGPQRPHFLAPVEVADGVLQDALEQQRQLRRRSSRVFDRQLQHRVLDDIQRDVPVAHCKDGLLERPPLYVREEGGQFLLGSQKCPSSLCGNSLVDALPACAGKPCNRPHPLVRPADSQIGIIRGTQPGLWRPCRGG